MNNKYFLAFVAGFLFVVWPVLMNRSGLQGFLSATVFVTVTLIFVSPFVYVDGVASLQTADWRFWLASGIFGAIGLLAFTRMLSITEKEEIGLLLIIVYLVQVVVSAIYHIITTGTYSIRNIIGFVAAAIAVYCLGK